VHCSQAAITANFTIQATELPAMPSVHWTRHTEATPKDSELTRVQNRWAIDSASVLQNHSIEKEALQYQRGCKENAHNFKINNECILLNIRTVLNNDLRFVSINERKLIVAQT
jgi:hypothetical protein